MQTQRKFGLGKSIAWNSFGSSIYLFFQWLITYLVTRLLGFHDAGIFSLAMAIGAVAFAISLYGVRGYQVSDLSGKYSERIYILSRFVTSLVAVIGVGVYGLLSHYDTYMLLCILTYTLFKMTEAHVDVYHGIIQKAYRMDLIGKSFILRGIVGSVVFIVCAYATHSPLWSIVAMAAVSLMIVLTYDRPNAKSIVHHKHSEHHSRTIYSLLVECFPLAVYSLLASTIVAVPRVILEQMRGSELLGIYASVAIPAVIIQVVAGFIFAPLITVFAEHYHKKDISSFTSLFVKTLLVILGISVVVVIAGWLVGDFGLKLLFGQSIAQYTYLFIPVLILSAVTAISWFIGLLLTVVRNFTGLIIPSIVGFLICLMLSRSWIEAYSLNGVSLVLIVALLVQTILMLAFLWRSLCKARLVEDIEVVQDTDS